MIFLHLLACLHVLAGEWMKRTEWTSWRLYLYAPSLMVKNTKNVENFIMISLPSFMLKIQNTFIHSPDVFLWLFNFFFFFFFDVVNWLLLHFIIYSLEEKRRRRRREKRCVSGNELKRRRSLEEKEKSRKNEEENCREEQVNKARKGVKKCN